jgi:hypothetical protein
VQRRQRAPAEFLPKLACCCHGPTVPGRKQEIVLPQAGQESTTLVFLAASSVVLMHRREPFSVQPITEREAKDDRFLSGYELACVAPRARSNSLGGFRGELFQLLSGETEDRPVVDWFGSQSPVETNGRLIPIKNRPFHPRTATLKGLTGEKGK